MEFKRKSKTNPLVKDTLKIVLVIIIIKLVSTVNGFSQPYIDGHKRYSFAQTVLGLDLQYIPSGAVKSASINSANEISSYNTNAMLSPRFTISGLHFWGHADLFVTIPFGNLLSKKKGEVNYSFSTNTETGVKVYPWRIEAGKIRPYIGLSMGVVSFAQRVSGEERGPFSNKVRVPLKTGFTYNRGNQLLELGLTWYHHNQQTYPINQTVFTDIETPSFVFSLGYKFYFDSSISAAPYEEKGYFEKKTKAMSEQKLLNGLSLGLGMSSAFVTSSSDYNATVRPFLGDFKASDVFLEYGLGYYLFKPDLHFNIAYRNIKAEIKAYGVTQQIKRQATTFETYKFLGDYHGFVPFVGPAISYEQLSAKEVEDGVEIFNNQTNKVKGGITFGWDIRPHRLQGLVLRTNLRYFPNLKIDANDNKSLRFDNLEFNFIQAVYYPGVAKRIKKFKVTL